MTKLAHSIRHRTNSLIVSAVVTACRALLLCAPACAEERAVGRSECKDITARIVEETGAQFAGYSTSGANVFKSPEMTLECMTHRLTGVSIGWDQNAFPDNSWFSFAAKAGHAVTGVDPKQLKQSIRKCHRQALKETGGVTELETPNAKIECQALTRNGGCVFISIWVNDYEARKGIDEP